MVLTFCILFFGLKNWRKFKDGAGRMLGDGSQLPRYSLLLRHKAAAQPTRHFSGAGGDFHQRGLPLLSGVHIG